MDASPRRIVIAAGLFFGGIVVGSAPTGTDHATAHAATAAPPPEPAAQPRSRLERGAVAPALRRLQATKDDGDAPDLGAAARCQMRDRDREPARAPSAFGRDLDDAFAGLKMPDLPVPRHPRVLKYVRYFTENPEGRKFFLEALRRSGRYQEVVGKSLRELGLPQELEAVAFVESGFSSDALSTAGAAGLWQFMPQTARAYGLVIESTIDERASIWKSTDAAAHHLADLYERFRSWELALAAYNVGYDRVDARLDEYDTDDFWTLAEAPGALPKETREYVPKVLGAAIVLANLDAFHMADAERAAPVDASELEVPAGTKLSAIARAAGTSVRALRELNPELLSDVVPDRGQPFVAHVPRGGLARARVMLPRLLSDGDDGNEKVSADFDWGKDDVGKDGRSRLERTAASSAHDTGNRLPFRRLRRRHDGKRGLGAVFTTERGDDAAESTSAEKAAEKAVEKPVEKAERAEPRSGTARVYYRVTPGDSLRQVAASFGLTLDQLLAQAHASAPEDVKPGTMLKLDVPQANVEKP